MRALPLISFPFRRFIVSVFDRGWTKCSLGMHHVCLIPRARLNRLCSRKAVGSALLSIYLPVCVSAHVHVCKGTHKAKTTQIDNDRDADTGTEGAIRPRARHRHRRMPYLSSISPSEDSLSLFSTEGGRRPRWACTTLVCSHGLWHDSTDAA